MARDSLVQKVQPLPWDDSNGRIYAVATSQKQEWRSSDVGVKVPRHSEKEK